MNCKHLTIACALSVVSVCAWAGENKKDSVGYQFTVTKELKTNSVKDQSRSGTCWSFSTLSFIEDDLLRQGKPAVDLSEMFIVRNDYIEKAIKYVRMHGSISFSAGGSAYDDDPFHVGEVLVCNGRTGLLFGICDSIPSSLSGRVGVTPFRRAGIAHTRSLRGVANRAPLPSGSHPRRPHGGFRPG